jgi:transposase InsO family protein
MPRSRRTYTPEFKAEAAKLVTEQGYSVAEAARSLGISENLICNWKQALRNKGADAFPGQGKLPAVEDLYSRRVVGWAMAEHMESRLVVDALGWAVQRRLPGAGLLAHSDRGSQYAGEHYQRLLAAHGITCSMSRQADCWDNAPMESFFASLKKELVHGADFATREEARAAVVEYIEVFYNNQRRHSSLGYVSPAEYEQANHH